ncbi:helix-turn-helix transcriptional regulator [Microbacterium esteraromaticum]|uniref:helix-turn-helix transcriptional regulator n=1 Tax=Microbacterium esteraromaticum TaxID=57043 RepID=UPI0015C5EC5F|nr:AraC family transcriptional regulator [Microbacterium esteraromaticum]
MFITAGWARLQAPGVELELETGSIVTIPDGVRCSLTPQGFVDVVTLYVNDEFLAAQVQWLPTSHPLVHHSVAGRTKEHPVGAISVGDAGMRRLQPLLNSLVSLEEARGSAFATFARAADLFDEVSVLSPRDRSDLPIIARPQVLLPGAQVSIAARLIRSRLNHPWTISELAREVTISESQLTRLFRQELGISPAAFLWQTRIDRMADLLMTSGMTVSQAAQSAGWTSSSAAARAFRRRYGVSPRSFAAHARRTTLAPQPRSSDEGQVSNGEEQLTRT